MFQAKSAFSGFSVNNQVQAQKFYSETLGLHVDDTGMGLSLHLPGDGGTVFVYQKDDHKPATFTILNFRVDNIDRAVSELKGKGVKFEHYPGLNDSADIVRGISQNQGPDIAWFMDPAGNIISVLQEPPAQK